MERDFKGVWLSKEIYLHEGLTPTEKLLLAEIDSFSKNGECFASNGHFAKFLGISKNHVSKLLTKLVKMNLIKVTLIYKNGTKEIDKRVITPLISNDYTPSHERVDPLSVDDYTPIGVNDYDKEQVIKEQYKEPIKDINNNDHLAEFEALWSKYPRKIGKAKALKSFIKARKKNTTFENVEKGLDSYIKYVNSNNVGQEYIKHGSTWFNNECWLEDYNIETRPITIDKSRGQGFFGLLDEIQEEKGGVYYDQGRNYKIIDNYTNLLSQPLQEH